MTRDRDPFLRAARSSVTNIGRRPTLYEDYATTIETYVLDFSSDVYGERVRLFFLDRLREERKFPSVMDLKEQIQPRHRGDAGVLPRHGAEAAEARSRSGRGQTRAI